MDFTNKVALVTGAAVGIGRATAILLAQNGAKLVLVDINGEKLDLLKTELAEYGDKILTFVCDVSDEQAVNKVAEESLKAFGKIDILVNNAGIIKRIPMCEMSADEFRQVIDVDLNAPFIVSKAVIPSMIKKGHGKIINICSMMSELGRETVSAYAAAKGVMPALVSTVAPVIADGQYYIEVSAGVATPIDAGKTYGYVNVAEKSAANAFTFTFTDGEGYTICDSNGRYYYQKGTYNSFNLDANPSEGQYWSIIPQADGTVKILNRSVNKWWQYSTSYSSFGSYDKPQDGGELPKLTPVK